MNGKLILVVGPSGSGKGTLIAHAKPLFPSLRYPKSCTTRAMRPGENNGEHYYFLTVQEFKERIDRGEFLEWAEYGGNFYGTLITEVLPLLNAGEVSLKELEVQGARQIRAKLDPASLVIIFINAGSWGDMEARIRSRGPMSEADILKRKARYEDEMSFMSESDVVIENPMGGLERAKESFVAAIQKFVH